VTRFDRYKTDRYKKEHVSRVTQMCHVPTQRVTAVMAVTADTAVTSASDPARRRRPEVRKMSRFQHRFGITSEAFNQMAAAIPAQASRAKREAVAPKAVRSSRRRLGSVDSD
jgi:hypothetical protein